MKYKGHLREEVLWDRPLSDKKEADKECGDFKICAHIL